MFGKRKTSKFKSHIEAVVRISVDHDTEMTEEQMLDEFDQNKHTVLVITGMLVF